MYCPRTIFLVRHFFHGRKISGAAKRLALLIVVAGMLVFSRTQARAWGDIGHKLVAAIAWEHMSTLARRNVMQLLKNAPVNSDVLLFRPGSGTDAERDRLMFIALSTWPDYVRPQDNPTPHQTFLTNTYHNRDWHFINFFWDQRGSNGAPRDHPTLKPPAINIVERLQLFESRVAGSDPKDKRAIQLVWILHLAGDIHQPLHTSARVTNAFGEQEGDQGGNLFKLNASGKLSLHSYWDRTPERANPRLPGESSVAYIDRLAGQVMADFPRSQALAELKPRQYREWALEGLSACKFKVYSGIKRKKLPDAEYDRVTWEVSEPAIARAGYRLADMLNTLFGH